MKKLSIALLAFLMILAVYGCSQNNEVYEKMIEQGMQQIEKEEYERAENFFEKALDQKTKDEKATMLVQQIKIMLKAKTAFDSGDFETAEISVEEVLKTKGGTEKLGEKAKGLVEQMEEMEEAKDKYSSNYNEAKKNFKQGELDQSLNVLEEVLEKDLSHPFFSELKEDCEALATKVKEAKEETEAKDVAEVEAQAKVEAKAKAEAEKKTAAEKAEKEKQAAEEKEQKEAASKDIGAAEGYWLTEDQTEACHLTSSYLTCAVKQSDVGFKHDITHIHHISSTELELTFNNGHKTQIVLANNNVLEGEVGRLNRVSKEEANAIYEGYYELP